MNKSYEHRKTKTVIVVSGLATSLINFRGALLREVVKCGHDVIALAPADEHSGSVAETLTKLGVRFEAISLQRSGLNPWRDFLSCCELARLFRGYKPDVVFAYTAKPVIYSGIAVRILRNIGFYPMITGLGYAFIDGGGLKRKILRAMLERMYSIGLASSNTVIFQNADDEGIFQALGLLRGKNRSVCVNGSGIDLSAFPTSPLPNAPVFLMLARLIADKGIREYVSAARQVKRRYPNVVFRLAGSFDRNPASIKPAELQSWVDEGVIEYLGVLSHVQNELSACQVYVLPSYYREGLPRSILEALATGRPIITTDAPGCRETVVHDKNGFLVTPRDAHSLAAAMMRMLEMSVFDRRRMAAESRAMAEDKFDVQKVNAEMLNIMGL